MIPDSPCEPWVTGEQVAACCPADIGSDDPNEVFANYILMASEFLFRRSGMQFPGVCTQTTRPCADGCGCWDWIISPAQWPAVPWAWGWWGYGWGWGFEGCGQGDLCGCGTLSRAILPGYPVTNILEVQIAGEVIDPSEYRLDEYRWLTRLAEDEDNPRFWPSCQNLALELGEPGTWGVTYEFGQAPPVMGEEAAIQLACQLYLACSSNAGDQAACQLPLNVTREIRQGVTLERVPYISWGMLNGQWATGLYAVDLFLSAVNPNNLQSRPSIWSPDLPGYGLVVNEGS